MLKLFLWLRYLRKKRLFFLSIAAVALSAALLIVVNSLFTGFIDGIRKADILGEGDITLSPVSVENYSGLLDKLRKIDGVKNAAPRLSSAGLLFLQNGVVREVFIQAVERESTSRDFKKFLLRQKSLPGGINFSVPGHQNVTGGWVGIGVVAEPDELTDRYDLQKISELTGKKVILITFGKKLANTGQSGSKMKRRTLPFRICDIYYSGVYLKDNTVYLPYEQVYKTMFGQDSIVKAHCVKIELADGVQSDTVKSAVRRCWYEFASTELGLEPDVIAGTQVRLSGEGYESFFVELRKQMGVLLLIFGVISSVAILLVFCIFYMIVQMKLKDIAVIKSCGAKSSSVAAIFLGFGGCVGVIGAALGTLIGYVVVTNINILEQWVRAIFGIKLWRSSVYMFEHIPDKVNWPSLWWIVPAAVCACMAGAVIPAIAAARTRPVEILRYE